MRDLVTEMNSGFSLTEGLRILFQGNQDVPLGDEDKGDFYGGPVKLKSRPDYIDNSMAIESSLNVNYPKGVGIWKWESKIQ